MSTESGILAAMLNQYQNNTAEKTKSEGSKNFDTKNYFGTFLGDKEQSAIKKIRILPTKDGSTPFVEVHTHSGMVGSDKKVFPCLKAEKKKDCPFCEARELLYASGTDADKEIAKKYFSRKMYVVKVIDRDNEDHGVKFWRFNDDYRKTGILDKIFGVLQAVNKDITDPTTGRDLMVMIARDQNKRPVVQSISHLDPSPLSISDETAAAWLADERTWEDVYSVRDYDYLEIIVKGGTPVYDKEQKKFVNKDEVVAPTENTKLDAELTLGVQNVKAGIQPAKVVEVKEVVSTVVENVSEPEDDSDLPF